MTEKILFVDDDPNVLSSMRRQLGRTHAISVAQGGEPGLEMLDKEGPFAVVVSDMRMPGMDGVQFLREVKKRSPETVRIMLTGNADQQTAVDAVNEGSIFRFHTKPCPIETMKDTIDDGLTQYRLVTAERVLLEKTLAGSVKVLVDVLTVLAPDAFFRTVALRERMRAVAKHLGLTNAWELDIAAMLSPIGQITLPAETVEKIRSGQPLSEAEKTMVGRTPEIGRNLIANIPRLEKVSKAIYYQNKGFDGTGFPNDHVAGEQIPIAARILKVLIDLANAEESSGSVRAAFDQLERATQLYDPKVLAAARLCVPHGAARETYADDEIRQMSLDFVQPGDILVSGIKIESGTLLLPPGHQISQTDIERLRNKRQVVKLIEPVQIFRPPPAEPAEESAPEPTSALG